MKISYQSLHKAYWIFFTLTLLCLITFLALNLYLRATMFYIVYSILEAVVGLILLLFGAHSVVFRSIKRMAMFVAFCLVFVIPNLFIIFSFMLRDLKHNDLSLSTGSINAEDVDRETERSRDNKLTSNDSWRSTFICAFIIDLVISACYLMLALIGHGLRRRYLGGMKRMNRLSSSPRSKNRSLSHGLVDSPNPRRRPKGSKFLQGGSNRDSMRTGRGSGTSSPRASPHTYGSSSPDSYRNLDTLIARKSSRSIFSSNDSVSFRHDDDEEEKVEYSLAIDTTSNRTRKSGQESIEIPEKGSLSSVGTPSFNRLASNLTGTVGGDST
mmetsp:Transcript_2595/g.2704  ORF Transcript_2595/g.2704 Transcript_2595/m.2704 type:complete len:326 (+) Transcript_2595:435-1412(+)